MGGYNKACSSGMTVLVMHPYHPWVMHPYHPMPLSAACGTTLSALDNGFAAG
jgi:hypothetical protein